MLTFSSHLALNLLKLFVCSLEVVIILFNQYFIYHCPGNYFSIISCLPAGLKEKYETRACMCQLDAVTSVPGIVLDD